MSRKPKYNYYDDEFKATAVELGALPGVKAQAVAAVLDIHPIMLYRWKKEYRDGDIMRKTERGIKEARKLLSQLGVKDLQLIDAAYVDLLNRNK